MPSVAMTEWETSGAMRLDELEQVHADSRRGTSGRPCGTRQLKRTLFVALVAQLQVYCRDLHDLAIDLQLSAANPHQVDLLRTLLTRDRDLWAFGHQVRIGDQDVVDGRVEFGRESVQVRVHAKVLRDQGVLSTLILDALARYVVDSRAVRDPLELTI
jgi:hypothetical protein